MRRLIEWLALIGFAASVYYWLHSGWAAFAITAAMMVVDYRAEEIMQEIRFLRMATAAIVETLEQTNKELPRLDPGKYKGLWPL